MYMVRRYEGRVECSSCRTYGQWHEKRESAAAEWNERKQLERDVLDLAGLRSPIA